MCLNKNTQPIKFTVPSMVISCQGNYINSVSLAHKEAHGAGKPHLTKAQLLYPSWSPTFNNNLSTHGSPGGHFCTEGKHCTSFSD